MCGPFFFFYYDQMKKKQKKKHKGLSLYPPTSLCGFGRTGLEEKPDPERAEIRAGHPTPQRGPTVLGNAPLLSLRLSPMSTTFSLSFSPAFPRPSPCLSSSPLPPHPPPSPPIFTILPSTPAPSSLTPDTALPLGFHPFPAQPACCGGVVVL